MAGAPMSLEILNLRRAVTSFGYVVRVRANKLFFVNPHAEEVFIATKRPKPGFYALNRVDRDMWETMGAEGVLIFQNIITQELIKWLYEYAVECRKKGAECFTKRSDMPLVTIGRRIGRDHHKEYEQRITKREQENKTKKIRRAKYED